MTTLLSRIGLALVGLMLIGSACSQGNVAPPSTPTPDHAATQAQATQVAQGVSLAQATAHAATQAAQSTSDAENTAAALIAEATATEVFAQTATAVRATERATERQATRAAATAEAITQATTQAQSLSDTVMQLAAEGYLTRTAGRYYQLDDFSEDWAQLDWYQWWPTGHSPDDFVIRADTLWQSASTTANWFSSGCGFVFREQDYDDHYLMYLGLDGLVTMARVRNGNGSLVGQESYGRVDTPNGSAQVMLVAEKNTFIYFVNGKRVLTRQDAGLETGTLNLTLLSGTNKSYGTRCTMTNIELWELD